MKKKSRDLTTGPIPPTLLKMAGGMLFGFVAMSAFNAVDTYFVGKLGALPLAAMSYTFPIVMIISSIALGLGVGLSSTVSRAIGAGDQHKVKRLTTDGLVMAVLIVLIFSIAGILTIDPLFTLLGARGETLELVKKYMYIWYIGMPFLVVPMVGNSVIRATGDTIMPSIIMMVSMFTNMILDPLLIFGIGPFPEMGIAGAALATVIARFTTVIFSLSILTFREKVISLERPSVAEVLKSWKQIAYIGVPAALVQAINPLSLGVVTRLLAKYGDNVVAGFGAAGRIEMLLMIIPMSLGVVMAPFAGQNWGAGKVDRIKKGYHFSSLISLIWGGFLFLLFIFIAKPVLSIFSDNAQVIAAGAKYIRIMSLGYGLFGILNISSQCLNAINKPLYSALITLLKAFVINIPLALIGGYFWNETGIFTASFITNIFAGTLGFTLLTWILNKTELSKNGCQ